MNELENREQEQNIDRTKMLCKGYKAIYDFVEFKTVQSFRDAIRNGIIAMDTASGK